MMKFASAAVLLALTTTVASAQQPAPPAAPPQAGPAVQVMTSLPADSSSINHWYKQNVYDPSDNKIGEIQDVLLDREGKATAFIIGVGGFLGIGEKDVAVPFNAVRMTTKGDNKRLPGDEHHQGRAQGRQGIQVRPQQYGVDAGRCPRHHGDTRPRPAHDPGPGHGSLTIR